MEEQHDSSVPWIPITLGATLILGLVFAALILPKKTDVAYQRETPPSPVVVPQAPPTPSEPTPTETATATLPEIEVTRISQVPIANGTVIEGRAPGNWFFEASFPIQLADNKGNILAEAIAQAEGDWMTTELVPFRATLHFPPPATASGTLIYKKDNPSGLPEHDSSIEKPVSILVGEKAASDATMYVAFISEADAAEKDCTSVRSSVRVVPKTAAIATKTLEELLSGPTVGEVADSMLTLIPSGTTLNALLIKDGVANADFSKELTKGVAGSCKVGAIRAQIEETLKQFPTIKDVVISVNGVSEGILQP
jgi:hypothetical protein